MPRKKRKVTRQLPSLPEISPILQAAKMVDEAYKREMNGNVLVLSDRMQYALRYLSYARMRMEKEAIAKFTLSETGDEWIKKAIGSHVNT